MTTQHKVQLAVLRAIDADPGIEERRVAAVCGGDQRDVERAVELLVWAGAIEGDVESAGRRSPSQPMWLTDEGRRVLRGESPVSPVPRHE